MEEEEDEEKQQQQQMEEEEEEYLEELRRLWHERQEEEEELEFQRLWHEHHKEEEKQQQMWVQLAKHQKLLNGVIAVMGLPLSWKTLLADCIGEWAKCPVLCVQSYLDADDMKVVAADAVLQHQNQQQQQQQQQQQDSCIAGGLEELRRQLLVQRAFPRLLKAAKFHMSRISIRRTTYSTVVIKSRLKSTFELDRLFQLLTSTTPPSSGKHYPLLIIDCRFTTDFGWNKYTKLFHINRGGFGVDDIEDETMRSWYRPASWNEMEDLIAWDRHHFQPTWDLHLQQLLQQAAASSSHPVVVRRLVLDPFRDNTFNPVLDDARLSSDAGDAIKYLLTTPQQELIRTFPNPCAVEYRELRPYLLEKKWSAAEARGRKSHLCPGGGCVFKYSEALSASSCCGACGKELVSSQTTPAYTCRLCTLTLHKSCAERVRFKALDFDDAFLSLYYFDDGDVFPQKHACGSCAEFSSKCGACLFQTHLKSGPLPTIINHDSHPHLLSLYLTQTAYNCRACGFKIFFDYSYRCVQCASFYHWRCAFLPLELQKHEHGGHQHVMKLMNSLHEDGMEDEETYWCQVCGKAMHPEICCYLCQTCPYYVTHVECAGGYKFLQNPKDVRLVQQLQPQLEDAFPEIFNATK